MLSYVRHYPLAIAKLMCLCSPKSADLLLTNTGGFMGQTIISAIGVYISTSIDYLIILIILFAQLSQNKQKWHICGKYLGTGLLVGASLVAAYVVNFVPEEDG